jgi:hypothetical protein
LGNTLSDASRVVGRRRDRLQFDEHVSVLCFIRLTNYYSRRSEQRDIRRTVEPSRPDRFVSTRQRPAGADSIAFE